MGRFAVVSCVLAAAVASCFFTPARPGNGPVDARGNDGAPADTPTMCASVSVECVGDVLRTCSQLGQPGSDTTCGWGCLGSGSDTHCGVLAPAGGGVAGSDLTAAFPPGTVVISDGAIIDTDACSITGATGSQTCQHVSGIAVFRAGAITISGQVTVIGAQPAALVAGGIIDVQGAVDATGGCAGAAGGPGGHAGGGPTISGLGNGAGLAVVNAGGGGGGDGAGGGSGGRKNMSSSYGLGGASFGDAAISTLQGGGGGGGGGTSNGGSGGGGGGAVQLVSNVHIDVASTAAINAGGCGGWGGNATGGPGGGGGAGGTILLEAPTITVAGILAANGGGGGAGDPNGGRGATGSASTVAAAGGMTSNSTTGVGGNGGAAGDEVGHPGGDAVNSGGGGGGVGRIRLVTRAGQLVTAGATLSPGIGAGTSATAATAPVQ